MPLLFFVGSNTCSLYTESSSGWIDATKFMTGASVVGSIAIPAVLKHACVTGQLELVGSRMIELRALLYFGELVEEVMAK
ncbi:vacuolar protein sorting-associated protein 55 [Salvia divinorum]|uniref:Vacuolar protein sorting-associated protein 55 n=1 Tax=Salvia divinorum TaxID=28513 RepID=A0ABD1FNM7_SALDI